MLARLQKEARLCPRSRNNSADHFLSIEIRNIDITNSFKSYEAAISCFNECDRVMFGLLGQHSYNQS